LAQDSHYYLKDKINYKHLAYLILNNNNNNKNYWESSVKNRDRVHFQSGQFYNECDATDLFFWLPNLTVSITTDRQNKVEKEVVFPLFKAVDLRR